jgi:hypothetical protein
MEHESCCSVYRSFSPNLVFFCCQFVYEVFPGSDSLQVVLFLPCGVRAVAAVKRAKLATSLRSRIGNDSHSQHTQTELTLGIRLCVCCSRQMPYHAGANVASVSSVVSCRELL